MLNALGHYLQNLPLLNSDAAKETAPTAAVKDSTKKNTNDAANDGYEPSTRALLVSAAATDFDVHALKDEEVGQLQLRLQQYGLISGRDLDAFATLNTARSELGENEQLDAVAILDQVRAQFNERNTPYSERQSISRLSTLLHNMASARIAH